MALLSKFLVALGLGILLVFPFGAYAAWNPMASIVQCGNTVHNEDCEAADPLTGDPVPGYRVVGECTFCDFVRIAENVIDFLVYLTSVIVVLLFVYAGVLYVTSASSEGNISKAHKIFWNAFIGLVIVLAAWLLLDVLMKALVKSPSNAATSGVGPWTDVLCVASPAADKCMPKNPDTETDPTAPFIDNRTYCFKCNSGSGPVDICASTVGLEACEAMYTSCPSPSVITQTCQPKPPTGGGGSGGGATMTPAAIAAACAATAQYNSAIQASASAAGISPVLYRAIMMIESAGDATVKSPKGAVGLMQVMPRTAALYCGVPLSQAEAYLLNPQNNMGCSAKVIRSTPLQYMSNPESVAAYYNGGPKAMFPSQHCPAPTQAWQCQWDSLSPTDGLSCAVTGRTDCTPNTGYQETRNYVANMNAIAAAFASGSCTW